MLRFTHKLPQIPFTVAISGGPDSQAILDFLSNGKRKITAAYFNHGTEHGAEAEVFVHAFCRQRKIPLILGVITAPKSKDESKEEYWRNQRLKFFHSIPGPVVTGHNLSDVMESWIFSSLHGQSKLLPYSNGNVIRPFRATPKSELLAWCTRHQIPFLNDPSNLDTSYMRNHIRHKLMPEALVVNPGLQKVILKKVLEDAKTPTVANQDR